MDSVIRLLNRWQGSRFEWGVCDCVLAVADWVQERTGSDPADGLRLTYRSAGECQRETRFFTDPLACIGARMDAILPRTDAPRRGDVGVVTLRIDGQVLPHGAVCIDGVLWGLKVEGGAMAIEPLKVLAAWEVPACAD